MGFDVFNALDLMNNKDFLEKLKFGIGDGNLQYYLYNWKCPYMEPHQVSFSKIRSIQMAEWFALLTLNHEVQATDKAFFSSENC